MPARRHALAALLACAGACAWSGARAARPARVAAIPDAAQRYRSAFVARVEAAGSARLADAPGGAATVTAVIDAEGALQDVRVDDASSPALAAWCEQLLRDLAPFAPFPRALAAESASLALSYRFGFVTERLARLRAVPRGHAD